MCSLARLARHRPAAPEELNPDGRLARGVIASLASRTKPNECPAIGIMNEWQEAEGRAAGRQWEETHVISECITYISMRCIGRSSMDGFERVRGGAAHSSRRVLALSLRSNARALSITHIQSVRNTRDRTRKRHRAAAAFQHAVYRIHL